MKSLNIESRELNQSLYVAKSINVSCSVLDGEAYILLEDKGEMLKLDNIGTFIWKKINGVVTLQEIVENCLEEYEADYETIKNSVFSFINSLYLEEIVQYSTNPFSGVMTDAD